MQKATAKKTANAVPRVAAAYPLGVKYSGVNGKCQLGDRWVVTAIVREPRKEADLPGLVGEGAIPPLHHCVSGGVDCASAGAGGGQLRAFAPSQSGLSVLWSFPMCLYSTLTV